MAREHGSDPGIKSGLKEASASASVNPSEKPLPVEKIDESKIRQALPRSLCRGTLPFGDVECHVLEDGRRIISSRGFVRAFVPESVGAKDAASERRIARIINESEQFKLVPRIEFSIPGAPNGQGYTAEFFVDVCNAYVDALIDGKLHPKQLHIARRAWEIQRAFAKLGLVALIDEVTGYQLDRAADDLRRKFAVYLLDNPSEWARMFPPEYFSLLAKVYRVKFAKGRYPAFFGLFTRKFIYEPVLESAVVNELLARNPDPHHGSNHHQHFTPAVKVLVAEQLRRVLSVLRQSSNYEDFVRRYEVEFRGASLQLGLRIAS